MLMESIRSENSGCATNMMSTTHSAPSTKTTENKPTPPENDSNSQTSYMEFLAIMKDYTNSNCDAKELVQRMHSLLQQNDHLSNVLISKLSATKTERHTTKTSPRSCQSQKGTLHSSEITKVAPRNVTAQPPKSNTKICNTRSQEQVWIDLQLQVDHSLDILDLTLSSHHTPTPPFPSISNYKKYQFWEVNAPCAPTPSSSLRSIPPTTSPFSDHSKSLKPSKCPRQPPIDSFSFESDSAASDPIDGSLSAPMEEDDTSLNGWSPKLAECPIQAPWNLSTTSNNTSDPLESLQASCHRPLDINSKHRSWHQECDHEPMWGAVEEHPPDLLSCIDHSLLCDRENRFRLDWDVRIRPEARQKRRKRAFHSTTTRFSSSSDSESQCRSDSKNGSAAELTPSASPTSPSRVLYHTIDRFLPSEHRPLPCKTHQMSMENWDSMDFGTFQNRRVSRILSSCWNRRKLFGPYKNRIKLVNIDVPGRNLAAAAASHGTLGGSLASSLLFGAQTQTSADNVHGNVVPMLSGIGMHGNASFSTNPTLKNEKKLKRREERKRNMSLKMQETLSELDTTFTEQDLDVKGLSSVFANSLGGASISKLALSKLETLPLPESSNMPQDLKELKRKIEATEVKVEGTKHRHRKGGPCPRCQVQNQLRAARRAYHKRAVAHKKLPQIAATIEALTQAAACSSEKPIQTEPIRLLDPKNANAVVPFGSMSMSMSMHAEKANLVVSIGSKTEEEPRLKSFDTKSKSCGVRSFCKTSSYPTDGRSTPSSPNTPAPMHLTVSSA